MFDDGARREGVSDEAVSRGAVSSGAVSDEGASGGAVSDEGASGEAVSDEGAGAAPSQHRLRRALPWLLVYAIALVLIAFWPEHIDKNAGGFLKLVTELFPILTYRRIEFGTNIVLFVPLGVLLAILLPRRRYLIMPAGFLISLAIESGQGIFLAGRTASVSDLVSNTAGACLGLIAVEVAEAVRRRRAARGR